MTILVTGGSGFIGSNFIIDWIGQSKGKIVNVDKLTYAGNKENLLSIQNSNQYFFEYGDICDFKFLQNIIFKYTPSLIVNFAAESHVDRSINGPENFIQTNIFGTFYLLETARLYWSKLESSQKSEFRFIHISTDEIYGTLKKNEPPFSEINRAKPNSPYSASKAASDHLVRAWNQTYDLPVITTNCSNNYGPYQFPEKLIPLTIFNALAGHIIPIYGDGQQVRDWIYVKDHCNAIFKVIDLGKIGQIYNIGGSNEKSNLEIVNKVCSLLDELSPKLDGSSYKNQITFVADRPGHDRRYAINTHKIEKELGWKPIETFETGIRKTVEWYLNNLKWVNNVKNGEYRDWVKKQYGLN
jgi:dTDP-glucose 4,6-dehydratase